MVVHIGLAGFPVLILGNGFIKVVRWVIALLVNQIGLGWIAVCKRHVKPYDIVLICIRLIVEFDGMVDIERGEQPPILPWCRLFHDPVERGVFEPSFAIGVQSYPWNEATWQVLGKLCLVIVLPVSCDPRFSTHSGIAVEDSIVLGKWERKKFFWLSSEGIIDDRSDQI